MANLTTEELAMQANKDVLGYIRAENQRLEAEANGHFIFKVEEEVADHYANVYEYERSMAYCAYSDFYKEKHGVRGRLDASVTLREIEAKMNSLFV